MSREQHIARTFVELADTLVEDFDVIGFLQQMTVRCQELLDVTDAAVFLSHGTGLYSPAPCDPSPALARVLDFACGEGPAVEAHRTARPVDAYGRGDAHGRGDDAHGRGDAHGPVDETRPRPGPEFTTRLRQAGYFLAVALPMRLRQETIGSLLLLRAADRPLDADDLALAQTLADAATIGLLHARTIRQQDTVNEQLHTALQSRIIIEQAKGLLAARRNITLNRAFEIMRRHARQHRLLLSKVARDVIDTGSTLRSSVVLPHPSAADAE
ncbi:GAF and ANTAR domain-containing protein [Streptomyces sp. BH-SS-21]|uniref:GAF and ANTAR domain-containing protein n=1 Tax=Streptomyces liliiviolaceus TaxID=2823109 RepID=A0A940XZW2_9ACTN|nr:GAF and ANTAR domain-containing protein [Streptomyces liliiviolaceus]MBQ0852845.1 GAF and ANTAR domain-containing protein [Streptomyces liliiviolaceus]